MQTHTLIYLQSQKGKPIQQISKFIFTLSVNFTLVTILVTKFTRLDRDSGENVNKQYVITVVTEN